MKNIKKKYNLYTLMLIFIAFLIGGWNTCQAQSKEELKGIPIEESGISNQEYNHILNTKVIELDSKCGPLTLTLNKVYGNTNDLKMKHTFVQIKDNPNKPIWSACGCPVVVFPII